MDQRKGLIKLRAVIKPPNQSKRDQREQQGSRNLMEPNEHGLLTRKRHAVEIDSGKKLPENQRCHKPVEQLGDQSIIVSRGFDHLIDLWSVA